VCTQALRPAEDTDFAEEHSELADLLATSERSHHRDFAAYQVNQQNGLQQARMEAERKRRGKTSVEAR